MGFVSKLFWFAIIMALAIFLVIYLNNVILGEKEEHKLTCEEFGGEFAIKGSAYKCLKDNVLYDFIKVGDGWRLVK